jgi:hypothetical protein
MVPLTEVRPKLLEDGTVEILGKENAFSFSIYVERNGAWGVPRRVKTDKFVIPDADHFFG